MRLPELLEAIHVCSNQEAAGLVSKKNVYIYIEKLRMFLRKITHDNQIAAK